MDIKVFLSFRSEDTAGFAQALRDRLVLSFPKQVFLDNSSIPIGADLVKTIDAALRSCTVVVVIIGKNWQVDRDGRRRLKEPDDYVRLEVSTALRLKREVLPVLVHGAKMPRKDELPPNVLRLLRLKAARIDEGNWDYDVGKFIKSVEDLLAVPAEARALPA